MKFFSPDSRLMHGLSRLIDGIWINLLMLFTSLPIITIGAAISAGYDAARREINDQGHVTINYFRAFVGNFVQATLIWLIFGATLCGIVLSWIVLQIPLLMVAKIAFALIWLICFEWVWALQARFHNSILRTVGNSLIFGISYIGQTVVLVVFDAIYIGLLIGSWFYMPQGLFLLLLLGYGSLIMLHTPVQTTVFSRYERGAKVTDSFHGQLGESDNLSTRR